MLNTHGLVVIPKEPELKVTESQGGALYFNFKAVSEGREVAGKPNYSYWECNMYVPKDKKAEWEAAIKPGTVLFIEHGNIELFKPDGLKYPVTRVRLDSNRVKEMTVPVWAKKD